MPLTGFISDLTGMVIGRRMGERHWITGGWRGKKLLICQCCKLGVFVLFITIFFGITISFKKQTLQYMTLACLWYMYFGGLTASIV